jgi:NAD(P)-dependent dehydrogenase (short-subunit alcohol dehydrogenase family)
VAQKVLITGCSSGIGRACATAFTRAGYDVVATARQLPTLDDLEVADRIQLDVTKPETVSAAMERTGDVDILINNAGSTIWGPLEEIPISDAQKLFETNVWGPLRLFQAVLPGMRNRGKGLIVNVSSRAAESGGAILGVYSASKAALSRLSESLRREVEPFGVRVSAIELAGVLSDFPLNRQVVQSSDPVYQKVFSDMEVALVAKRAILASSTQAADWILGIAGEENPAARYVVTLDQQISRVDPGGNR